MNDRNTLLAAARKAARRLARASGRPYQSCLDDVARQRGRAHWSAFLADPVDARPAATSVRPESAVERTSHPQEDRDRAAARAGALSEAIWPSPNDSSGPERRPSPTILDRLGLGAERAAIRRARKRHVLGAQPVRFLLGRTLANGPIGLADTVPVLVTAPPGSGKTAAVTVPFIVSADDESLVVHDEAEVWITTSGHRATLGSVHVVNLAGAGSNSSFNPLSGQWLPDHPAKRASYLHAILSALCPDDGIAEAVLAKAIDDQARSGSASFPELDRTLSGQTDIEKARARQAMRPFLEPAVASVTTRDGYAPADIHGTAGSHGAARPTTLYIVRGRTEKETHGRVAATLQAAIWWWALNYAPGETRPDGSRTGAPGVTVILDDLHRLPRMPALVDALEKGRAVKLGTVVTVPSDDALRHASGMDGAHALFGVQIALPLNDPGTAYRIASGLDGVRPVELMAPRTGWHMVSLQGESTPIRVRTPFFFRDPDLLPRVFDFRTGRGPSPVR